MPASAKLLPLLLAVVVAAAPAHADDIRTERVHFAPGGTGAVIAGSITGRETVDYLVSARAGQTLSVAMQSDNTAAYFNVIPPDAENVAVYAGHSGPELNRYEGTLDLDGDWKLRVYLYRAAARRGERADYRLDVSLSGDPDPSAAREANDFGPREWDARGDLGCARGGQPMQTAACPFKVKRYQMESGATVFVLPPGVAAAPGAERILYFQEGEWSTPTADAVSVSKRADLWTVTVGEETYEIPEAVVFGG
ncbi:hypothetical protein [Thiohalocapsa sp.]|uniref:hypothetical protein n=1 Tax=Thiohalocapsa sp. TaxID=2497641 RepID=UPI0025F6EBCA|nr:hypothetical protein [Thiohalocapsa sp.]